MRLIDCRLIIAVISTGFLNTVFPLFAGASLVSTKLA